jgi:hypothetical protein
MLLAAMLTTSTAAFSGAALPERDRVTFQAAPDTASVDTPAGVSIPTVDTSGVVIVPPPVDTTRRVRPTRSRWDQPRWVMLRSLVVPGWGQVHNGAWLKAAGVAGGEVAFAVAIGRDEQRLSNLRRESDAAQEAGDEARFDAAVLAHNQLLEASIRRRWLLGGLIAYALVDAYVDAHFVDFEVEFESDPALPPGSTVPNLKLSVGWRF